MKNISIFGTSSDAGKSTITFVVAKIIEDLGYSVTPFKAQNVSNNAMVADDGSEIAVAQYFQADILGVPTSYHLNPVLLKSGRKSSASLIVNGRVIQDKDVREYYRDLDELKPIVAKAFRYLDSRYDCVVAEGAGSPVELNLMDKDLSNIFIASEFNTKIILVADIEKGGVFASIWGVYNLLPKKLKGSVIGVIINKFRGDLTLFDEGVRIIEEDFKIPVLGVLPYIPFNLGFEDSQSLINYKQTSNNPDSRRVGVIAYPTMSNYNDFEPLIARDDISLEFIKGDIDLDSFDEVILSGSKLVIKDLEWLKEVGLFRRLKETKTKILGICGGYEMMFSRLIDRDNIESNISSIEGLGFIDDDIIFQRDKIVKSGHYTIFGKRVKGFEIHHGVSKKYPLYYQKGNIRGTFVHGIFNSDEFERYKRETIDSFVSKMRERLDVDKIMEGLNS